MQKIRRILDELQLGRDKLTLNNEAVLSAVFAKSCILLVMIVFGAHMPLTLLAQLNGLPFETYLKISPFVVLLCIAFAASILIPEYKGVQVFDTKITIIITLLGALGATLALLTNRHSSDDYFYIPNAVHFLENPAEKMDFVAHFYQNTERSQLTSYNQGTSLAFEYFQAVVAYYAHTNLLNIYYIYSLALMGFLVPIANFLLISKFTANTSHALVGTVIAMSVLLMLTETGRTFGNFAFPRVFQGKAVFMSIGIPAFVAFSLSYFGNKGGKNWISLFCTTTALIGMTSTAAMMIPMLALVLVLASRAVAAAKPPVFRITSQDVMYVLSTVSAFMYAALLFFAVKSGSSVDPMMVQGSLSFNHHIKNFIDPAFPLSPLLVVVGTIGIFFVGEGWRRTFLVVWIILLLVLFLNPLSAKLLVGTIVPPNIYWRLFYLFPFPLVAALVGVEIWRRLEASRYLAAGTISLLLVLSGSLVQYWNHFYRQDQIQLAGYKTPPADLVLAQKIADIAPDGLMLAPPNIYGLVPMLTSGKPQVRMRGDSRAVVERGEYLLTIGASRFAGGETKFEKAFLELVSKKAVDVLVIKSALLGSEAPGPIVRQTLKESGYISQVQVDEYTIFWR